jgi:GxxExxY protein
MQTPEVLAQKAEAKLAREAARAEIKAQKEAEKAQKEAEKERLKAEKAAAKAAQPPKPRGRPKAVKPTETAPEGDMAPYEKLDLLRSFAEEVYASLGAGHLESIYHAAMAVELRLAGMMYESEQIMSVTHKGMYVGTIRADIIVEKACVLEFKISGKVEDAKQQARQYMKLQGIKYGFVVMFPKVDGGKVQFVDARVVDEE